MGAEPDPGLTETLRATVPFAKELEMSVVEATPRRVVTVVEWTIERTTTGGAMHGGYLMSVADTTASLCAFLNLTEDAAGTSTIEAKTNFVGAVRSGRVTMTAEPIHVGRTTIVLQTDGRDDQGRLVTRSIQTQAVLRPRGND